MPPFSRLFELIARAAAFRLLLDAGVTIFTDAYFDIRHCHAIA